MKIFKSYASIILIFCLAFAVRLAYNYTVARGYVPKFDADSYHVLAKHILEYHCYCYVPHSAVTNRAPFWPFVLAAIYTITGPTNAYGRLFLCFIGSGTCMLIYLYAKNLFGQGVALFTGSIAAIYTGLFIYDGWLYAESLYTFLLLSFSYSLYRLQTTAQKRWVVLGGLSLALASLTRPNGPILLVLLCLWGIIIVRTKQLSWKMALSSILFMLIIAGMIIAPWTLRNYKITHQFILVSGGSGIVLSGSYNDTALQSDVMGRPGLWIPPSLIKSPSIDSNRCCEYQSEAYNTTYALTWIRNNPDKMPYLLSMHFVNMWVPYTSEEGLPVIQFQQRTSAKFLWNVMNIMPFPVYLFAAVGLLATWKRHKKELTIVYLVLLQTIAQGIAFYGSSRFRAPIEPLLILLVGGALWWLAAKDAGTLHSMLIKKPLEKDAPLPETALIG